jgi:hypothetical protein
MGTLWPIFEHSSSLTFAWNVLKKLLKAAVSIYGEEVEIL